MEGLKISLIYIEITYQGSSCCSTNQIDYWWILCMLKPKLEFESKTKSVIWHIQFPNQLQFSVILRSKPLGRMSLLNIYFVPTYNIKCCNKDKPWRHGNPTPQPRKLQESGINISYQESWGWFGPWLKGERDKKKLRIQIFFSNILTKLTTNTCWWKKYKLSR